MRIRRGSPADLEAVSALESLCFPPAEAAGREAFARRLAVYPDYFWLLEDENGALVSFINGMATDEPLLRDEMYEDASLHDENGAWQMIFGVNTHPRYRRQGCAARLMERVLADTRARGKRGCVLTCKKELVHYYEKFGYRSEGVSRSTHGGVVWYDMRLTFEER